MARLLTGMFENFDDAREAVEELEVHGYGPHEINLICGDRNKAAAIPEYAQASAHDIGAAVGGGAGAVLGGATGFLAGLTALAVPGFGPILAAGTLTAAFAGAGVGAIAGGVVGGLVGMGISQDEAYTYEQAIRRGGTLVIVRTDEDRYQHAIDIMDRHHVADISERHMT